jgi:nucleoside-diphosphate-sugar epimerase
MKVLVAGGGGYLGLSSVRALVRGGHDVVGLVRTPDQAHAVQACGSEAVIGDLLEPTALPRLVEGVDAVIHLAQPSNGDLPRMRSVRVEGGRNLARAVAGHRETRFIVGSGYWVYASNPGIVTEDSPLAPRSISKINFDTERAVVEALGPRALPPVVVRPGMVYGNGSWFAAMVRELTQGEYRYVGDGANFLSPVHLDDAGEAFRLLAERGHPGATYLVVDDAPVQTREFAEFVASQLGSDRPTSIPLTEAVRSWGEDLAVLNAASRAASNARLRSLGWSPRWRTFREGVPPLLREVRGSPAK